MAEILLALAADALGAALLALVLAAARSLVRSLSGETA
jgi:hypothetical protein